jgi:putative ABC transport system permease protein
VLPLFFLVAVRNIARTPVRNGLTVAGVATAVAILVMALSTAAAFKGQIHRAIRSATSDVTVQTRWARSPVSSVISRADLEALRRIAGVRAVTAVLIGRIRAPWSDSFTVVGVSSLQPLLGQMRLTEGRPFEPGRSELLLGQLAATRLGYGVGNKMLLTRDQLLTVSGVYNLGVGIIDGSAIVDLETAQRLTGRTDSVSLALLQLDDPGQIAAVTARIAARLPDLTSFRSGELASHVTELKAVDLFAWIVSVSTVLACILIVTATVSMAVAARTREIGVLIAIGWSRAMIVRTVLAEGVIVCLTAALAGNVLARVGLALLDRAAPIGLGSLPVSVPLTVALSSFVVAGALGALSALYPAAVASRVAPARALRYE